MSRFLKSRVGRYGLWLCVGAIFLLPLLVVRGAAFDYFLKIEGVPGESMDQDHKDWIQLESFSHGVARSVTGTGTNRVLGPSQHSEYVVRKSVDKSTPILMESVCAGKVFPKVEIHLVQNKAGTNNYMTITLEEVFVSSIAPSGSGSGVATNTGTAFESLSLNYSKIEWRYFEYDKVARTTNSLISTTCSPGGSGVP